MSTEDFTNEELCNDLTVFEMGLSFALCHTGFHETRNAIRGLQEDFKSIAAKIRAMPTAERSENGKRHE